LTYSSLQCHPQNIESRLQINQSDQTSGFNIQRKDNKLVSHFKMTMHLTFKELCKFFPITIHFNHSSPNFLSHRTNIFYSPEKMEVENFHIQHECFKFSFFRRDAKFGKALKVIQIFFIALLIYSVILEAVHIYLHSDDVMEAAETFGTLATAFIGMLKMITFYSFMDKFDKLMENLNNMSLEGLNLL
jgi:hypothetical protein